MKQYTELRVHNGGYCIERIDIRALPDSDFDRFKTGSYEADPRVIIALKEKDPNIDVYFDDYVKMFCVFRYDPVKNFVFDIGYYRVDLFGMWVAERIQYRGESVKEYKLRRRRERSDKDERDKRNSKDYWRRIHHDDRKWWGDYFDEMSSYGNPYKRYNQKKPWFPFVDSGVERDVEYVPYTF